MFGISRRFGVAITTKYEVFKGFHINAALRTIDSKDNTLGVTVPPYQVNSNETTNIKRARLLYQSRKRGMLENDLLLSTFIDKYLFEMDPKLLSQYDSLINSAYSDWDIYYWVIGSQPVPSEFDNEVMSLLKSHVENKKKEKRIRQPELPKKVINK